MKCPFCANELQNGFLNSERGLFYSEEKWDRGLVFCREKDDIKLSGPLGASLPVLRCETCRIVYLSTVFKDKK